MQFVAFEARDPVEDVAEAKHNPFLSRDDMRAVLARSMELYQSRNGGILPKRLVIHKTTAFKQEEIDGTGEEVREVAETVREIGLTPWSAQGTAERQAWAADLADEGLFGPKGTKEFARSSDWRGAEASGLVFQHQKN